jgi:hypothetical protein
MGMRKAVYLERFHNQLKGQNTAPPTQPTRLDFLVGEEKEAHERQVGKLLGIVPKGGPHNHNVDHQRK